MTNATKGILEQKLSRKMNFVWSPLELAIPKQHSNTSIMALSITSLPPAEHVLDGPFLLKPPDVPIVRGDVYFVSWQCLRDHPLATTHAPPITGILLRIFVFLTGTPLFALIRNKLMRKNGIPQLLAETHIPERPTMTPLQPPTIPEASQEPANTALFQVMEDDTPQARIQAAFASSAGLMSDTRFPSIADYHEAYKSGWGV